MFVFELHQGGLQATRNKKRKTEEKNDLHINDMRANALQYVLRVCDSYSEWLVCDESV